MLLAALGSSSARVAPTASLLRAASLRCSSFPARGVSSRSPSLAARVARVHARPTAMASASSPDAYGEHSVVAASGGRTPADAALADALVASGARVVLESKSFTRRAILTSMGIEHDVVVADIDERAIRRDDPEDLVLVLAHAKADAIVRRAETDEATAEAIADAFLVTSDQVVVHDGAIREKPEDEAEARAFIASYGVTPPSTVGAIVVTDVRTGARFAGGDRSTIVFAPVPGETIEHLVREGECMSCAGGLMVEHPKMAPLVKEIQGSMDGLMGLSKTLLGDLLGKALEARREAS